MNEYRTHNCGELNESNSTTENITTEKMRDVEASVKSFYNSLASSMGVSGYNEEDLSPLNSDYDDIKIDKLMDLKKLIKSCFV